jgi:hypothetical protein
MEKKKQEGYLWWKAPSKRKWCRPKP